ncbi:MAG: cytochrome b N-terminal domain-containing protein [Chloroflexi bacterium]|nr:cytochrome b N-terminal domain-containing protein [Chloroflexota bacterium]
MITAVNAVVDWLDERFQIRQLVRDELTEKVVPKGFHWLRCFGGISLVIFIIMTLSGMFLMLYYIPETDKAFQSIVNIDNSVSFGWLVRRIHAVGSNLMIITVVIHMLRVFYQGAFKKPRELHWVSGVFLLLLTLALCFSGYVLVWSQMSFWATTVVTNSVRVTPFIGDGLLLLIRGSNLVTQATLSRFFALHVVIIPVVLVLFMLFHFWMIRRTGISQPL